MKYILRKKLEKYELKKEINPIFKFFENLLYISFFSEMI